MIAYSTATIVTGIVAIFFLLLALIVLLRTVLHRQSLPARHRYRVGVFVEHDHQPGSEHEHEQEGTHDNHDPAA